MEATVNKEAFEDCNRMENEFRNIPDHTYASRIYEKPFDASREPAKHKGHSSSELENPKGGCSSKGMEKHNVPSSIELRNLQGNSSSVPESPKLGHSSKELEDFKGFSSSVIESPKDRYSSIGLEKQKGHSSSVLKSLKDDHSSKGLENFKGHSSSVMESPKDSYSSTGLEKQKGHSSSVSESPKDDHSSKGLENFKGHSSGVLKSPKESHSSNGLEKQKGHSSSVPESPKLGHSSKELENFKGLSSSVLESAKDSHSSNVLEKQKGHSSSVSESPKDDHSSVKLEKQRGHSSRVLGSLKDSHSSSKIIMRIKGLINKTGFRSHVGNKNNLTRSRRVLRATTGKKRLLVSSIKDLKNRSRASSSAVTQNSHGCKVCGKVFRYKRTLHLHKRNHRYTKPFKCWACKKCFLMKSDFAEHLRMHIDVDVKKDSSGSSVKDVKDQLLATSDKLTKNSCPCDICGKVFKHTKYTPGHKRSKKLKTYICLICKKPFDNKSTYNSHLKKHKTTSERKHSIKSTEKNLIVNNILQNPFACNKCGKVFKSKNYVNLHEKSYCKVKQFKCSICKRLFRKRSTYDEHVKVHDGGVDKHSVSASVKTDSVNLSAKNLNSKEVGENSSEKLSAPICAVCSKTFPSRVDLFEHLKSHRIYSCKLCRKQFMFKTDFILHMNTNHGKKESNESNQLENDIKKRRKDSHKSDKIDKNGNECDLCQKIFPDVDTLQKHKAGSHVEGEFHACNICPSVFPSKRSLSQHYLVHTERGEMASSSIGKEEVATSQGDGAYVQQHIPRANSNQCKSCKKIFQSPTKYLQHRLMHCKKMCFTCHICNTVFNNPDKFGDHMKSVHEILKPYNCEECDKSWAIYRTFVKHKLINHENINVFKCKFCGKNFVYRKSFIFHLKNSHELVNSQTHRESNNLNNRESKPGKKQINNEDSDVNWNSATEKEELPFEQQSVMNDDSDVCSTTSSSLNSKVQMNEQNSEPHLACNFCNLNFKSNYFMKKHNFEFHGYDEKMTRNKSKQFSNYLLKTKGMKTHAYFPGTCTNCKRVFRVKHLYDKHISFCHKKRNKIRNVDETVNNNVSSNKKALKNHKEKVNFNKETFACHICPRVFNLKANLARHFISHKGRNKLFLKSNKKLCLKSNKSKGAALRRTFSRIHYRHCKICGKTFSSHGQFLGHLTKNCKYEPIDCDSCKISFVTPAEFGTHMKQTHRISNPFICSVCGVRCSRYMNYIKHRVTHEQYQSSQRIKTFSTMKRGNSQKNKVRKLDSNQTSTISNILVKPELPSEEKLLFVCTKCKLEFCRKHLYFKHVEICQNEENVDSVASFKENLISNRKNIELEERSLPGRHCMEKNTSKDMEEEGRELVENENPEFRANKSTEGLPEGMFIEDFGSRLPWKSCNMSHVCNLCKRRFKNYYYMTKHLKAVHRMIIKPVPCKKCNQLFSRKSIYINHTKICHNLEVDNTVQEIPRDENDEFPEIEFPKEENFIDIDYPSSENCGDIEISKNDSFQENFSDGDDHIGMDDGVDSDSENNSLLLSSPREILKHYIEKVPVVESYEMETEKGNATKSSGNGVDSCTITTQDVEECRTSTEQISSDYLIDEVNIWENSSPKKHMSKAMQVSPEDKSWILKTFPAISKNENISEKFITEQKTNTCFNDVDQRMHIEEVDLRSPEKDIEEVDIRSLEKDVNVLVQSGDICSPERDVHVLVQSDNGSFEEFPVSFIPKKIENNIVKEVSASNLKQCPGIYNSTKKFFTTQRKSSLGAEFSKFNLGLQPYKKSVENTFLAMTNNSQDVPHDVNVRNLKIAYANSFETNVIDMWMKY